MIIILLVQAARASTWSPVTTGFPIDPRNDAPIDAIVPFGANYEPTATASIDGGPPVALGVGTVVTTVTANPTVGLLPPAGGWPSGALVELEVLGYYEDDPSTTLSFEVGAEAAGLPVAPTLVGDPAVAEWSQDTTYAWGCCQPTREVVFTVESGSDDPWAYVQLRGVFPGPSQLTTAAPAITRLDAAFGPGTHTLSYEQWDDDGELNPTCFELVGVSASGAESSVQALCLDADGHLEGEPRGCRTGPGGAFSVLVAAALLGRRARRPA